MKIPFIDLKRQYDSLPGAVNDVFSDIITNSSFVYGQAVQEFESSFSKKLDNFHTISCASGTDAIFVALKCLGIGAGDEVLTPAFSWISSAETISLCHARPVFVDVDPDYYTLDPARIEKCITRKTKAIVVVHLYGQMAQMDQIMELCERYRLFLIEDCAQAHMSRLKGKVAGTFGHVAAFSFYPTKNLGAYGDAGCVLTSDDQLAERIRRFANHGALQKNDHLIEGMNSRMDTLQAAFLLMKLPFLDAWNESRREHASLYSSLLSDIPEVRTPSVLVDSVHTFHIYALRARDRDSLQQFLLENGIQTLIHYPKALPNLKAYRLLGHRPGEFEVAGAMEKDVLSLPIFPELQTEEIHYICQKIKAFYQK